MRPCTDSYAKGNLNAAPSLSWSSLKGLNALPQLQWKQLNKTNAQSTVAYLSNEWSWLCASVVVLGCISVISRPKKGAAYAVGPRRTSHTNTVHLLWGLELSKAKTIGSPTSSEKYWRIWMWVPGCNRDIRTKTNGHKQSYNTRRLHNHNSEGVWSSLWLTWPGPNQPVVLK